MFQNACRWVVFCGVAFMLLGCLAQPVQPDVTQPHGLLALPEDIQLVALDNQTVDARAKVGKLRLAPGLHTLRFAYAGSSLQHTGQTNDPLSFRVQAGHQYTFEAKT